MYELALKVHRLTDIPLLSPGQYDALFSFLAEEVNSNGFSRTSTLRNIEDRCEDKTLPINAAQISFVIDAVIRGGINLAASGKAGQRPDRMILRKAFRKSADELCKLVQCSLDENEQELRAQWLQPGEDE